MAARTAQARDGTALRYQVAGEGPVRVALTHSLAMDGDFWSAVVAALPETMSAISWDCRGHGRSDKPAGPYMAELFADDLAAVLDDAGWDRVIAAGASMGGCVTLAFGQRHAGRALALGLFDTTASYGPTAPEDWEGRAQKACDNGLASLVGFQQTRWFSDRFRDEHADDVRACVDTFTANDLDAYVETCRMLGRVDLRTGLPAMDLPVAILVGEEDYATPPAMAEALHAGIAGSTLEVIPGARHLTPIECPELIVSRLTTLAERIQP